MDHEGVIEPLHPEVVGGAFSAAGGGRWGVGHSRTIGVSSMRLLVQVDPDLQNVIVM